MLPQYLSAKKKTFIIKKRVKPTHAKDPIFLKMTSIYDTKNHYYCLNKKDVTHFAITDSVFNLLQSTLFSNEIIEHKAFSVFIWAVTVTVTKMSTHLAIFHPVKFLKNRGPLSRET